MTRLPAALVALGAVTLAGCSTISDRSSTPAAHAATACEQLFRSLDTAVERAGVRDGAAAGIDGFPYLRTNRFLASFRDQPLHGAEQRRWIDLMRDLDSEARILELANLPERYRADLDPRLLETAGGAASLTRCAEELVERDLSDPGALADLRAAIEVPDEYQAWKRVLGLYPLSALPFLQGVAAFQADRQAVFATPLEDLPIEGRLTRYAPPPRPMASSKSVKAILASARNNPLQIPVPRQTELVHLFATFAPILEIDEVDRNDQIGMPGLRAEGEPVVDVSDPVVFVRTAHTRYGEQTLLQLVYSFWFPARPPMTPVDLLAGRLDGITWRVTLDNAGNPLLFDSIHNCGCYHMFFPTERLRQRETSQSLEEPIFVPSRLTPWRPGERVVLRIEARTHYLQDVRQESDTRQPAQQAYAFLSDDRLRSLAGENNARYSLFRPDGIVPGTQRGERLFFWPMGVPDPGAMRQWGRHATAFVGRRHFDEPRLIERYFEVR
jgi:hypothetical protein